MSEGNSKQRFGGLATTALVTAMIGAVAFTGIAPARAADHDFYGWRDGYGGPVYGYYVGGPYGYYYPTYTANGYPALGFYDGRSYYSYYYGRTDFGYQDTK